MKTTKHIISLLKLIIIGSLLVLGTSSYGQNNNLNIMGDWSSSIIQPGRISDGTISAYAGVVSFDLDFSPITLNKALKTQTDGSTIFDLKNIVGELNPNNLFSASTEVHTFGLGLKIGNIGLSVGHAMKLDVAVDYTDDLINLAAFGNAPYIGKTLDLSTAVDLYSFNEMFLGLQYKVGSFSVGGRLKYLNGIENLRTKKSKINLTTDEEIYALTLKTDIEAESAALLDYNTITDYRFSFSGLRADNLFKYNHGFAFDLGVNYKLSDKINVWAAISDIGSINWDRGAYIYKSQRTKTFDGIDLTDILNNKDESVSITDTLYNLLDLEKKDTSFSTNLRTNFQAGAIVSINDKTKLGTVLSFSSFNEKSLYQITLQGKRKVLSFLEFGASYTLRNNSFTNLGLFTALNAKNLNVFMSTENVLSAFSPKNQSTANVLVGISLKI